MQRLLIILSILSLTVCGCIVIVWLVLSPYAILRGTHANRWVHLSIYEGIIDFTCYSLKPLNNERFGPETFHSFLGCSIAFSPSMTRPNYGYRTELPLKVVLPLTLLLPVATVVVRRKVRLKMIRNKQCLNCGYDLRATLDRCPECGTVPLSRPEASPPDDIATATTSDRN